MRLNKTSIKKEVKKYNPHSTKGGSNFNSITLKYKINKKINNKLNIATLENAMSRDLSRNYAINLAKLNE